MIGQTLCLSRQSRQFRYLPSVEPVSHSLTCPIGLWYDSIHASLDGSGGTTVFNKTPAKAKWSENTFPHQEKPSAPSLVPLLKQKTSSNLDDAATIAALRLIFEQQPCFYSLLSPFLLVLLQCFLEDVCSSRFLLLLQHKESWLVPKCQERTKNNPDQSFTRWTGNILDLKSCHAAALHS